MPQVTHLKPQLHTVTPPPSSNATPITFSFLPTTTLLPWEEVHMQVHTILIVIIFCVVCFLLLLAFFYAFCFHCSIGSLPKDTRSDNRCSLDREDATYKCSSTDTQSVGNVVWLEHRTRITAIWLSINVFCCVLQHHEADSNYTFLKPKHGIWDVGLTPMLIWYLFLIFEITVARISNTRQSHKHIVMMHFEAKLQGHKMIVY